MNPEGVFMFGSSWLRDHSLKAKFRLLLAVQVLALVLMAWLGWWALGQFQAAQEADAKRAPLLHVLADLRFRMTHYRGDSLAMAVSASKSAEVAMARQAKLLTIAAEVDKTIEQAESLSWLPEDRDHLARAIAAHRSYAALLQEAMPQAALDKDGAQLLDLFNRGKAEVDTTRQELGNLFLALQSRTAKEGAETQAMMARQKTIMALCILVAVVLGAWISRSVASQVTAAATDIESVMRGLSGRDLTRRPGAHGSDELGQIARSLGDVIAKLHEDIKAMADISEQTASSATELSATTDQLNTTTREISHDGESQQRAMRQSSTALAEVSRSMGEVRAQAQAARGVSDTALATSAQGLTEAGESQRAMTAIEESSAKVGRITTVIADIARQTNLLSLNAAIEAAKAGAQGKGFAVVAEEIRKLAERSASAAKEINLLIQESTDRVAIGTSAVDAVSRALAAIEASIRDNAERVMAISKATDAQAQSTDEVMDALGITTQITERNASATAQLASSLQETAHTVEDLAGTAGRLRELTSRFVLA
jgi:methyl-accepting chemotaxis protein